ncbi:MAG: sigma-70 family RNA polymerase sigma factor [Candidatus Poribacteria bacterium]|nr:sigma-70 family RNA polymerase sigma factor [Candidatus Poribacteria bacterium]
MNDVRLNRRFVEADDTDEQEVCRLIFNAYYKIVFDAVSRMFRGHPDTAVDADDITSETFTKAFNKRKDIQEPEKLVEWLITSAKNLMIDKMRRFRTQIGRLPTETVGSDVDLESQASFSSTLAETDTEYTESNRYRVAQLLRILQEKDREIVVFILDGFSPKEIAETTNSTPEAVQKRWERLRKWLEPIARNLDALVDCLPEENDRKIMERYLDGQPLSEITKAIGISRSDVEERVKRVITRWKKASRENPTDPVSAMVKKEKR